MRSTFITITALLILYGCSSGNLREDSRVIEAESRAADLYAAGEYELAASEYLALARTHRAGAVNYRLSAADAYLQNGNLEQAGTLLEDTEPAPDHPADQIHYNLLNARLALAQDLPDQAQALLEQPLPPDIPADLQTRWYTAQVELYERQRKPAETVLARLNLEPRLNDESSVLANTDRIWELLQQVDPVALNRLTPVPVNLRPWLELVALYRAFQTGNADAEASLRTWSASYPDHPANIKLTGRLLVSGKNLRTLPTHIALLLPLSGPYRNYSEKIRDGFLGAWFVETSYKPVVKIYDTDISNVRERYQQAVQAGADFIVGPLQKEAIKALTEQPLPVRTLALNQIDPVATPPVSSRSDGTLLVQFGLPPEDEAREVARRAIREGHTRALVIAVADEFGNRAVNAFSEEWNRAGGRLLERINYDGRTEEFISPVKQLLNIDSSESRIALLRKRLGRGINSMGRLRNDADFIFMVAPNLTARQIVPHLQFFGAGSIPVFSVSSVFNGIPDPQTDVDLNNVEFVDMPWLLGSESNIYTEVNRSAETGQVLPRYYAFGIDAFRLIPGLAQLAGNPAARHQGETGQLSMTADGIIHRHPVWARFVDGIPQRIEPGAFTQ